MSFRQSRRLAGRGPEGRSYGGTPVSGRCYKNYRVLLLFGLLLVGVSKPADSGRSIAAESAPIRLDLDGRDR